MVDKQNAIEDQSPREKFMSLARICVKKQKKGLFDQLITAVYRLKNLTSFIPELDTRLNEKEQLILMITKGLKFKNFKEFKEELCHFQSFEFLNNMSTMKDYFIYIVDKSKNNKVTITVAFLSDFQMIIKEHYHALNFLKGFVCKEIEVTATKLAHIKRM